jgi:hypothetical protein
MIATIMLLAGLGLGLSQEPELGWLVGTWCTEPKNGRTTCETWEPRGTDKVMRGVTVTTTAKGEQREPMRISGEGAALVFHAEPTGQAPADFPVKPGGLAGQSIEFLDTKHDYPQRIRYWREGTMLMAEISLADGSKPIRWAYKPVAR